MWVKLKPLLVILSVALNLAFIGTWTAHAVPARFGCRGPCAGPEAHGPVWCPLHRELGATEAQWQEIEPRLAEFQKSAQELCRTINQRRLEMIDLLAAPEPDREALRAKQEEILAGQRQVQELVIEHLLAEKDLLTPEQRETLFEMFRQRTGCAGHGPMMRGVVRDSRLPRGARSGESDHREEQ